MSEQWCLLLLAATVTTNGGSPAVAIVSMFARKQPAELFNSGGSSSISADSVAVQSCSQIMKKPRHACIPSSSALKHGGVFCTSDDRSEGFYEKLSYESPCTEVDNSKSFSSVKCKKKARQMQSSQLSLKLFFQKTVGVTGNSNSFCIEKELTQAHYSSPCHELSETLSEGGEHDTEKEWQLKQSTSVEGSASMQGDDTSQLSEKEKNNVALVEWQRIQQQMQTSIPLCKGHREPCVPRMVKKSGPNIGRRFYVCARAEGPASNPEANCGFFKWATSSSKRKGRLNGNEY